MLVSPFIPTAMYQHLYHQFCWLHEDIAVSVRTLYQEKLKENSHFSGHIRTSVDAPVVTPTVV
jgi:hypothetical protein